MRPVTLALLLAACGATPPIPEPPPPASDEPPADPDGDTLTGADVCPCVAEDEDGWQDGDGCPDLDDDTDGIVDGCDRCPRDAEVLDEVDDGDGCPDAALVRISDDRIVIVEHLLFERNSAELTERSRQIVEVIAQILADNPQILRLRLVGHAQRGERRGGDLSLRRAETVRDALVALGVAPERLIAEGAGTAPLSWDAPPDYLRSVTYEIVELAERPPPPVAPPAPEPPPCEVPEPRRWCSEGPTTAP